MTSGAAVTVIQVDIVQDASGTFYATSKHVPGLHMWGESVEHVCKRALEGIKVLFQANHGLKVELRPYTEPEQFMSPAVSSCNKFALARAA